MSRSIRHCIKSQQYSRTDLEQLFENAQLAKRGLGLPQLPGKILVSLFYEPSTRTRFSFESAMLRLGGSCMGTDNAGQFSSAVKGESLEDSVQIIGGYGDVIVLRHTEDSAAERAAAVSSVPIINAGCGKGQHPTQALLDVFTIWEKRGTLDGISVALAGDLANGRTIRSLAYLLGKFDDVKIDFASPFPLRVGRDILAYLKRHDVTYSEHATLDDVIGKVDVCYMTRVQKERMVGVSGIEAARLEGLYRMTPTIAARMKPDTMIMHPLPRNTELPPEIDEFPQAVYFEQAKNGLWVRMALLSSMLSS